MGQSHRPWRSSSGRRGAPGHPRSEGDREVDHVARWLGRNVDASDVGHPGAAVSTHAIICSTTGSGATDPIVPLAPPPKRTMGSCPRWPALETSQCLGRISVSSRPQRSQRRCRWFFESHHLHPSSRFPDEVGVLQSAVGPRGCGQSAGSRAPCVSGCRGDIIRPYPARVQQARSRSSSPSTRTDLMRWTLLDGLDDGDRREVLAATHRCRFARGEVLFREGEVANALHLIDKGTVGHGRDIDR